VNPGRTVTARADDPQQSRGGANATLLAGEHGGGLAFQVDVRFPADVHGKSPEIPARERPWGPAGIVVGDGLPAVAPDTKALAGETELAGLGLDPPLADLGAMLEICG
jgi:hypothetical protein